MRLHVVSLPHTATTREFEWCAYTSKVRKFCDMMADRHEITLYAGTDNEGQCAELMPCSHWNGSPDKIPPFEATDPLFADFNNRAIVAMRDRLAPQDLICLIGGLAQKPIADAFPDHMTVEFGVGYGGVFAPYRVFESYAWMHTVYGALSGGDAHGIDGRFYDTVIPNYFDADDFPAGDGNGGYLLYVGRLIERKGVEVAAQAAKATGMPLHVAGAGEPPEDCVYHGVVGPQERADLMGEAAAILAPTLYVEPFGGVAVEAQMCGTPAITTDWGAFTETVERGVTGFRCRTMREFVDAVQAAPALDRDCIRQRALGRYSLAAVGPQYDDYFARLRTLWGAGFYANIDALARPRY